MIYKKDFEFKSICLYKSLWVAVSARFSDSDIRWRQIFQKSPNKNKFFLEQLVE